MKPVEKEVVIVGAGPCGVAAAVQLVRSGIDALLIERRAVGGLLHNANWVENYPGMHQGITGPALCRLLERHLEAAAVEPVFDEVLRIGSEGERHRIVTHEGDVYHAQALILATGTIPNRGFLDDEKTLAGRSVFYEVRDALDQGKGRRAAIMGGGDAAYDYALNLASRGFQVSIVQRGASSCLPLLEERARGHAAIRIMKGASVRALTPGTNGLGIEIETREDSTVLDADFMIIACGRSPDDRLLSGLALRRTDGDAGGLPKGIFLGGDLVRGSFRQAGIAVGDGLAAAMAAVRHVRDLRGADMRPFEIDGEGESSS
jgi:thioredoxin reductase (NADPH)